MKGLKLLPIDKFAVYLIDNRLKLSLGLPKIEPRPPCPPRIYQKLYKYLDSVLTAGTRRSGRPAQAAVAGSTPTSSPAKPRAPARSTPLKPTTPHRKARSQVTLVSDVPKWVMPTIRHLCRALGAPAAPHHVYAGVCSILTLPAPRVDEKATAEESGSFNISALIIVVYLLVVTRLSGNEMPAQEFTRLRGLAIASIKGSKITEAAEEVADSDHVILCVGGWMKDIGVKGWTELDWFANVNEGAGLGLAKAVSGDDEEDNSENDDAGHRGTRLIAERVDLELDDEDLSILKPGLGTMVSSSRTPSILIDPSR